MQIQRGVKKSSIFRQILGLCRNFRQAKTQKSVTLSVHRGLKIQTP
ncbi:hypothetical protein HFN_1743 [Helicobacter fennelliae MRY12-0050]|uniref:Uncharacterized protein n=1 Tax=Helicobacter fennelliae MRY12-0050 TaxID=1325130 RepID=T1CWC4_9HELI|nr:hypothetical protein HFN_1743 [Helicobacter fennelliae MRY12-0050]